MDVPKPTAAGLLAITTAYHRIAIDGYPYLCPLPIGKPRGPAIDAAVLRKLAQQGYSDDHGVPRLTQAGIDYVRATLGQSIHETIGKT
jgi:hypothetical protein